MAASDKSIEILNKFSEYKATGKRTLIESYHLEELKRATYELMADKNMGFYKAIEDRIRELKEIDDEKKKKKGKRISIVITFVLTVIAGLLIAYLKGCLKSGA